MHSHSKRSILPDLWLRQHPLATKAGMNILAKGGNAFDAITASAFMLAVVEPSMSGIGGRLQAVYHKADGKNGGIDATTQVPANYKPTSKEEENGFGTVGVPGMVKAFLNCTPNMENYH